MFRYYTSPTSDLLADLVDELVAADDDSARLAMDLVETECWQTHACRPRDLQHAGREALAVLHGRTNIDDSSSARRVRRRFRQAFELLTVRPAT